MNIKEKIIKSLPSIDFDVSSFITESADSVKGDYSLPCFALAKQLRKSPVQIAEELKSGVKTGGLIERCEVLNGYLNFFLNKQVVAEEFLTEFKKNKADLYRENIGKGRTICIDYSSVNLAKYMHIGHLRTTMIGESLARIFENFGFKIFRINYVGDYGTPFGKMICGYRLWGNKEDVEKRGIDAIQDLYVEFCKHESDESYAQMARDCFKKIVENDPDTIKIYNWFIDISIKETKKLVDRLGVKFDSWRGESYYSDKMQPIIDELKEKGLLKVGENNALIVDLGDLGVSILQKSDGTSLYATRDLATAEDRFNTHKFFKSLYVTDVSQKLHFSQFFKILELMGRPYAKDLFHVYYGRFSLPEGKISSRRGKQAILKDIIENTEKRALAIIKERNLPDEREIARKVGIGACIFAVLKSDKLKDSVFDVETALSFEGETSVYMQYTYARCSSILRKYEEMDKIDIEADYSALNNIESFQIVNILLNFKQTLLLAMEKYEPSVISKKLMELCSYVNTFYNKQKVLTEDEGQTKANVELIYAVRETLAFGFNLICLETIEKM